MLVDPVVGVRGGLVAVIADVHFELSLQPAALPIGEIVAVGIEERSPAEVDVADQHPAQMADMAHIVARLADGAEEFDSAHDNHKNPHRHGHRQRENPHLPVRHGHRAGKQHAIDGPGSSDRGEGRCSQSPRIEQDLHDNRDDPRAHAAQEEVDEKPSRPPGVLQVRAEHGQKKQVQQHVENACMQKYVGEGLPDEPVYDLVGHQSEIEQPEVPPGGPEDQPRKLLGEEDAAANNAQRFDGAREIAADIKTVAVAAGKGAHRESSLKGRRDGVKNVNGVSEDGG